jgi:predicted metal-dependent hydrolase
MDREALQLNWLDTAGEEAAIELRRSPRVRRLSVRVHRDARVEVVAPLRLGERVIADFVARHADWIRRRRAAALRDRPPAEPFPPALLRLAAFGEDWRVHLAGGSGRPRVVARAATGGTGLLELRGDGGSPTGQRVALLGWLQRHAREGLGARLEATAQRHGFRYRRMSLRRQRTRWGSCSAQGTISLNLCLVFQRPAVLEYLLLHELSHTRHMNHSRAFWRCVAEHCPDWQRLDAELLQGWRHVPGWIFGGLPR